MAKLPVNPDCELSGTKYCRELNMHACEQCTVRGSRELKRVAEDIDLYETLLPEGGVARLFSSKECALCKGDPKGKRSGFAILDMAHPEPKREKKWLLGKRFTKIGTMIPVQFSVCSKCRRRYLLMEYMPILGPVALGALGLAVAATGAGDSLRNWFAAAPFLLFVALILIGWLGGRAWSKAMMKTYATTMYSDVLQHPVIAEMVKKGWQPITTSSRTKLLFSKNRVDRGLGTAADAPAVERAEATLEA